MAYPRDMDIHVHYAADPRIDQLLVYARRVLRALGDTLSNQEELDARVAALTDLVVSLGLAVEGIAQAIADLKLAAPAVDFSGLDDAVGSLTDLVAQAATNDPGVPGADTPADPEPV